MSDRRDGPIRTLHILTTLHRRGAEMFAVQMIDHLDRGRFAPQIWLTRPAHSGSTLVPERTPVLSNEFASPRHAIGDLLRQLRIMRPHLIQCHGGQALKYAMVTKPFWRPRAYVYSKISSIHPYLDMAVKRLFYGFLQEQVDAIVAVGEEIRREVEAVFQPRHPRLISINNGRDVRPFLAVTPRVTAERRRELGLGPENLCLMQIGITSEKDPQRSLRVFGQLAPRFPELHLLFVGDGPLKDELRREATARGLQHRVRLVGLRHDVPALLSTADLVMMPSITEGLPGVLIEAGMAGRASVAYDVGSVRDVLVDGETGFVVPPGDAEGLAQRVGQLIQDRPLRERMGRLAQARCRRDFDIELSVRKYEILFAELVGSGIQSDQSPAEARAW